MDPRMDPKIKPKIKKMPQNIVIPKLKGASIFLDFYPPLKTNEETPWFRKISD
jgi:hypothetical protein